MRGKNKCKILKEIRQKIADENDIPYITQECSFQGECRGTCPRCEAELRYLEQQLEKRRRLGKTVTVAALSAGLMMGLTACPSNAKGGELPTSTEQTSASVQELDGSVDSTEPSQSSVETIGELPEESSEDVLVLEGDVAYIEPSTEEYETAGAPLYVPDE